MSQEATAQAQDIEAYIEAQAGTEIAGRFAERLFERIDKIGDLPFGGTPRDELLHGLRSVPFRDSATIFYRVADDEVLIAAVLYRGRDPAAYFDPAA